MSYVQFDAKDGTRITLETEEATTAGPVPVSRMGAAVKQVQCSFEDAIEPVKRTAAIIVEQMRAAFPDPPDELEVQFAVKASFEVSGLTLAKAAGEGSFTVKATWKNG